MNVNGTFDVAEVAVLAFTLFFIALIFYLRREDRREGYPLEDEVTGRIDTEDNEKNSPAWSTVLPARSGRRTARQSSMRRPRVEGSTLHARTSSRSSPPMPTPSTKRPGARSASVEIWRATTTGCRSTSR